MNITLYSLPGISKTDTPVFSSLASQTSFFTGLIRQVISTGFYPPYFKNSVKVDITDYNLTTSKWNYCSLDFNDKIYYYFIKNKRYINESIVELDIEMDTIQTYMFDVTWIYSMIDRITIPRWINGTIVKINRDYIRENISNNVFTKITDYSEVNTSDDARRNYTFVAKLTRDPDGGSNNNPSTTFYLNSTSDSNTYHISPYLYLFTLFYDSNISGTSDDINPNILTSDVGTNNYTVDMYLIPFKAIAPYSPTNGVIVPLPSGWSSRTVQGSTSKVLTNSVVVSEVHKAVIHDLYFKGYGTNTDGGLFDALKVPQLFDENYIKLVFGDTQVYTQYPLYTLDTISLGYAYWSDLITGARYYNLIVSNNDPFNNKYYTIVENSNVINIDLKNDPWKEYISNNKATLTGMFAVAGVQTAVGIATAKNETRALIKEAGSIAEGTIKYVVNKANKQHAPYSVSRFSDLGSKISSGNIVISKRISFCDDFVECAEYFESFGYKVAEHYSTSLFLIHNRHLYDFVKTSEIKVQIGDKASESDFIARFNDGLRMWHTSESAWGVGLYIQYGEYSGRMGDCLKYDNLDEWRWQELQED